MALASEDDGFREIQLSGKQLVFLFMAATVVSVVIFLCGVLVGRGVRAERAATMQMAALNESPIADVPPRSESADASQPDPRSVAAPAAVVGEPEGAEAGSVPVPPVIEEPPVAVVRSAPSRPEPPPAQPAPVAAVAAPKASPGVTSTTPPAGTGTTLTAETRQPAQGAAGPVAAATASSASAPRTGYAVQVAAVDGRGDADAMVKRLTSKGYSAYVEQLKGSNMYRVRVGTFRTRREAQVIADKLKREEKFNPWVTR